MRGIVGSIALLIVLCAVTATVLPLPEIHPVKIKKSGSISPLEGINYTVDEPLIVGIGLSTYKVPKGFETDLASIPRALWSLIAPSEAHYVYPAILHDYMYACHKGLKRYTVDSIFYSFLRERKVSRFKAYQFFLMVRLFGGTHYISAKDEKCLIRLK